MKKVLIIDDNVGIRDVVSDILILYKYQPFALADGEEIITAIQSISPHIILLDVLLPGKDGISICKELKHDERFAHIPIILFSAGINVFTQEVINICDAYVEKPFDMDELIRLLAKHSL